MLPVVTPVEMARIDASAPEPVAVLIERAGRAVAGEALDMLGGGYGRRVVVYAGSGNNGADGFAAARFLEGRGVRCEILSPEGVPRRNPDLVIDGCVGTGLGRPFSPPTVGSTPVLAIDIPSGVDGLTGEVRGAAFRADRTVTFAAHKPGLLLGRGPDLAGRITLADIGLDVGQPRIALMTDGDLAGWPVRPNDAHKWGSAVWVIGGQPGMTGAPALAAEAAARSGAGYVAVSTPGGSAAAHRESVSIALADADWSTTVVERGSRFAALVIGPGLPTDRGHRDLAAVLDLDVPAVLDAGAIDLVADQPEIVAGRPVVLTPHDGEFERLTGRRPGSDRIETVRRAAADLDAVVLLKGPTTVIAAPDGRARIVTSGDQRLATAGTGDVLSGVIGSALTAGLEPLDAAALGAHLHGKAAIRTGRPVLVASDLLEHLSYPTV
jgi:hydroxyethylthiazole kinase-like uncharacterized protein yjeF